MFTKPKEELNHGDLKEWLGGIGLGAFEFCFGNEFGVVRPDF